jgi:hypothetical protein
LMAIVWPSSLAVTPDGMTMGFLPIRDIVSNPLLKLGAV